jgi:hypothetical protein
MNDDHARKVSVTGCVLPFAAPAATASQPSSTAQAAMSGQQFMLSNVAMPTPSASETMKAWSPASSYILQSGSSIDLSKHLNHKVEITGTVDGAAATDASAPAAASGTPAQTFHVTSLKMVSATCP